MERNTYFMVQKFKFLEHLLWMKSSIKRLSFKKAQEFLTITCNEITWGHSIYDRGTLEIFSLRQFHLSRTVKTFEMCGNKFTRTFEKTQDLSCNYRKFIFISNLIYLYRSKNILLRISNAPENILFYQQVHNQQI